MSATTASTATASIQPPTGAIARRSTTSTSSEGYTRINVGAPTGNRGCRGQLPSRKDYRDIDDSAVNLGFVHVGDGGFGILLVMEQNVGGASVRPNYFRSEVSGSPFGYIDLRARGAQRTGPINRQVKVFDGTKLPKYFVKMVLIDILRKSFNNNLL